MSKYLILDNDIVLSETNEDYPNRRCFQLICSGAVPVWYKAPDAGRVGKKAAEFSARLGVAKLLDDVNDCVRQLTQKYNKQGTGYIALGASPKLIKWRLKSLGFSVTTVNASGISYGDTSTEAFNNYLERKLTNLGVCQKYIVMDFADSGAALAVMKDKVKSLRASSEVISVAIGSMKAIISYPVDLVIGRNSKLSNALQEQTTKLHMLGRNKIKNKYSSWSKDQQLIDNTIKKNSNDMREASGIEEERNLTYSEFFKFQKEIYPSVLKLPKLELEESDWMQLIETAQPEQPDNDDSDDFSDYSVDLSDYGGYISD